MATLPPARGISSDLQDPARQKAMDGREVESLQQGLAGISQLHALLQRYIERLHDAVYMLPRQDSAVLSADAYARDLVTVRKQIAEVINVLPNEIRRGHLCKESPRAGAEPPELAAVLSAAAQKDHDATVAVIYWARRVSKLHHFVNAGIRQTCAQICGNLVVCEEAPTDELSPSVVAEDGDSVSPTRLLRPRLQDLVKDKSRRFVEELEFVQCLASPEYVQWLGTQPYFEDPAFLEFLRYLRYWLSPPYIYHVVYPQGLAMLEMLQNPEFRRRVHRQDARKLLTFQALRQWAHRPEMPLECTVPEEHLTEVSTATGDNAGDLETHRVDLRRRLSVRSRSGEEDEARELCDQAARIGRRYLMKNSTNADFVFQEHRRNWAGDPGACDLMTLLEGEPAAKRSRGEGA